MEFENTNLDPPDRNPSEKNLILTRCGEIIITENPPLIAFNLICLYCENQSQTFDDFKNHFLNDHYYVEESNINLTRLGSEESTDDSDLRCKEGSFDDYNDGLAMLSINNSEKACTKNFESKFKNFYENEIIKETSCDTNCSIDLEPEIQFERYDEDFEWESLTSNTCTREHYSNSESETQISESAIWSFEDSDALSSSNATSLNEDKSHYKIRKSQSCSLSRKNHNTEKTIEIYKEEYVPDKPKFILAAVNLPNKSKQPNDDQLSRTEPDPNAFPQNEIVDNHLKVVDEKCAPKFKFNNIKFRRHHNERYYLSIEKTFNEDDGLFHCPECSKRYKRIETLRYHYLSHTGVPAPFQCSICRKGFPSAYKVRIHFTKHTGERPFRCHLCPRVYRHKQQLKFHLESHVESTCNQDYINNSDMNVETAEIIS